jgi:hypothetical protein
VLPLHQPARFLTTDSKTVAVFFSKCESVDEELHNLYSFVKYNYNNQVKKDEMGTTCNTNGMQRNAYRHWWESQKERDH